MLLLASLLLCAPIAADAPFVDLSFDAALSEAKSSNKVVMIDFFTTWCGPCKKLDRVTWKDAKVVEWLGQRCVPLKIDAEKAPALARRFSISVYPTIVFVDASGNEIDRIRGFCDPDQFLGAVSDLSGKKKAAATQVTVKSSDPMIRLSGARVLLSKGSYADALAEYLWCWDEGVKSRAEFAHVRRSVLLADLSRLARVHPPARDAMLDRRDAAEVRLLAGSDSADDAADACALSRAAGEPTRGVAVHDALKEKGKLTAQVREAFAVEILDSLARAQRYVDITELVVDPVPFVNRSLEEAQRSEMVLREIAKTDDAVAGATFNEHRASLLPRLVPVFSAALAGGQNDEGKKVAQILIEYVNREGTYVKLVEAAMSVGNAEIAKSLAAQGIANLPNGTDAQLVKLSAKLSGDK